MLFNMCLTRSVDGSRLRSVRLGQPLLDSYLAFVGARARPNTWLAVAYDLKAFFDWWARPRPRSRPPTCSRSWRPKREPRRGETVVVWMTVRPVWLPAPSHGGCRASGVAVRLSASSVAAGIRGTPPGPA